MSTEEFETALHSINTELIKAAQAINPKYQQSKITKHVSPMKELFRRTSTAILQTNALLKKL
jgi:hypothetical protein